MQIRHNFEKSPNDCSISSVSYAEQSITRYGHRPFLFPKEKFQILFGNQSKDDTYVEISHASTTFINFFRFEEGYLSLSLERINYPYFGRGVDIVDMSESLYIPLTIKVYNLGAQNIETAVSRSSQIIDACLFELSYLKNIPMKLEENWPLRQSRVRPFRFEEPVKGNDLPLPQVTINPDIIRFYQRGMGSDDPVEQFLSFYHVLEYYFVAVSDEQLYSKLARRIND